MDVAVGHRVLEQHQPVGVLQHHAQAIAAVAVALVGQPQRDQLPAFLPRDAARREQLRRS